MNRVERMVVLVAARLDRLVVWRIGAVDTNAVMIERPALPHRHSQNPLNGYGQGNYEQQDETGDGSHCGPILPQDAVSTIRFFTGSTRPPKAPLARRAFA